MKSFIKRLLCLALAAAITALSACAPAAKPGWTQTEELANTNAPVQHANAGERFVKLSANIAPAQQRGRQPDAAFRKVQADFAVELFKNSLERGENSLVSPLSVLLALAMTANGADANTLAEMERVLGLPIDELNAYLYTYMHSLNSDADAKLKLANSIWFRASEAECDPAGDCEPFFTPDREFLQRNAAVYDADLFAAPFDDGTLEALNDWVKENTDGMIERILDEIDPAALMYLVNTLLFDAKWEKEYAEYEVGAGVFTSAKGERQEVTMMHSTENAYIGDDTCFGFLKYYKGGRYAFAALLPSEETNVNDFIDSLTGERLIRMLDGGGEGRVHVTMPKFSFDHSVELPEALKQMGMVDAFDPGRADFSRMGTVGEGSLYIANVLHKTHIEVGEKGTRAGAATLVEMNYGAELPCFDMSITLDRPFVFMIMDMEANVPLFIGALTSVN